VARRSANENPALVARDNAWYLGYLAGSKVAAIAYRERLDATTVRAGIRRAKRRFDALMLDLARRRAEPDG
jgi:hypothetical protein